MEKEKNKFNFYYLLGIIFLSISCIFNALRINDLNNKISSLENNKIVETKGVKRAFENAPIKTNNLNDFNKDFKLFFNINTGNEMISFLNSLDIDKIYYIGQPLAPIIQDGNEIFNLYLRTNSSGNFFVSLLANVNDTLYPIDALGFKYENSILYSNVNGVWENINDNADLYISTQFDSINNELLKNYFFVSKESVNILFGGQEQTLEVDSVLENNYIYGYDGEQKTIPSSLLSTITLIATGILNILISLFNNVLPIFWVNNAPTFIGTIVLFAVAIPITYWVINFILGLIRKIRLTRGK